MSSVLTSFEQDLSESRLVDAVPPRQSTGETRQVDPDTGAQKGRKLARFDLIPPKALWELAEHFGKGSLKYEDRNWERGYDWLLSFDALCRHLFAWAQGEDYDDETGSHHLIAVAWHAFALRTFADTHPEKDNRVRN